MTASLPILAFLLLILPNRLVIVTVALFLLLVLLLVGLGVVFSRLRKRSRPRPSCPSCGNPLPAKARACPTCGASLSPARPEPSPRPSVSSPPSASRSYPHPSVPGLPSAPSPPAPQPSAQAPYLVALQGPLVGQRFPIPATQQGLTIGRHPHNDVVLGQEAMVSRFHAQIVYENGQFVLYDRDSANGTWVNDQRVFRHVLSPGDRIQIWGSEFAFTLPDQPIPSPPRAPSPVPLPLETQNFFEGYRLEGLLGEGGMSKVFKARSPDGRVVAIKILQVTDAYLVHKFEQEGNRIGPILQNHPHIVSVYRYGKSQDGHLYIIMEYVEGQDLRKWLVRQTYDEADIRRIIGQTCLALAYAHEQGIVHRDIKPENILVARDGTVKVVDFGIAKLTSAVTVTRDKIVGTPEYMSPEQAKGERVRFASDVYSLGIVLYEMLTGNVPFPRPGGTDEWTAAREVINHHIKTKPVPPSRRVHHVPRDLEKITMRALEKDWRKRYRNAGEMGKALGYKARPPEAVPPLRPTNARLIVVQGPGQGRVIPLKGDMVTIGRADLDPSNSYISRQHANFIFRGGQFWLEDTSTNGTWVNGERVYGEVPLKENDLICIGTVVLRLAL